MGETVLISGTHTQPTDEAGVQGRHYYVSQYDDQGQNTDTYAELYTVFSFNRWQFLESEHMPSFWWAFTGSHDGSVYVFPHRDQYRIDKFSPDGELELVIERAYESSVRSEADTRKYYGLIETALAGSGLPVEIIVEKTDAAVADLQRGLRMGFDGNLWVLTGAGIRDNPEGVLATFDVFESDGVFARQVQLMGEGNAVEHGIFFAGEDRVIVVKGYIESLAAQFGQGSTYAGEDGEAETPEVVCYRVYEE